MIAPGTRPHPAPEAQVATSSIAEALAEGRARLGAGGVADAALEAELLLRHALGDTREALYARLREAVPRSAARTFDDFLCRRLAREPTPYITDCREFYGLDLACSPAALIPRPETELIVDLALDWLKEQHVAATFRSPPTRRRDEHVAATFRSPPTRHPLVVDVGTGTGAIAIAIAVHAPQIRVVAIDVSREALALARRNAAYHGVAGRIYFVRGSLLAPLRAPADLVVANLPYVPTRLYEKLPPELRDHEPEVALHAGPCGTSVIEALLAQAPALLRPGGLLLAEHQWDQGPRLRDAARASFPRARVETARDLAGQERVLVIAPA